MPDIEFTVEDAIARLNSEREDAIERVEREYQRLVADLRQSEVARQQLNNSPLKLQAAAIAVVELHVNTSSRGFWLEPYAGNRMSCELLRPLKPGKYNVTVIFTEDEVKTETPK